jgi:diadenosine tetraphosphate (Ap4A) HIT family hydrolase
VNCPWCDLLQTQDFLYQEESFVLLSPGAARCARNQLTLLPRTHVSVLTEMPAREMTAVLAGLSRLSAVLRRVCGVDTVELWSHPKYPSRRAGHLHFHPAPKSVAPTGAEPVAGAVVEEIARAMSEGLTA